MEEKEFDALVAKVGKEAAETIKTKVEESTKGIKEEFEALKTASISKEDLQNEVSILLDKLKDQAKEIEDMKKTTVSGKGGSAYHSFKKQIDEKLDTLKNIKRNSSGVLTFELKAAGVTGTVGIGAGDPSLTNTQSAASSLAEGGEQVYTLQRVRPSILDYVTVIPTDTDHITYRNEVAAEGDFAITAEGAVKPLKQYKFEKASSDAVKVAGHTIITDEFERNYARLWALIRQLMVEDCNIAMEEAILTDMIANASPYALDALDDAVDNADNYAAIIAVVTQLQLLGYTPNILALNPADAALMRLEKDTTGQYIIPPFMVNGNQYEFGRIYVDPTVTQGNFFLGNGSNYRVEPVGNVIVRMGYINDQLITNEMTLVVERYFHKYIPEARSTGFVYASFATVKADLETP